MFWMNKSLQRVKSNIYGIVINLFGNIYRFKNIGLRDMLKVMSVFMSCKACLQSYGTVQTADF
jgi:hypothetical protein